MNHAISRSPVAMSGAGMSRSGPIIVEDLGGVAARDPLHLAGDSRLGSHRTPPLAPPKGSPSSAHLKVIHIASAAHSPSDTPGA